MEIYERIKERRKLLNLTAEEVCQKLNISRSTLYRYESAEIKNIPIGSLEPLAKALSTNAAYLMGWTNDPDPNWLLMNKFKSNSKASENLNFLVKTNHFTLDYLAKETGIQKEILEDIISGKNDGLMLSGEKMIKLAGLFGLELDELYGQLPSRIYENFEPYSIDAIEVVNAYTQAPPYYKNSVRRILGLSDFHSEDISEDVKHA